jgi:60 kDa SS-A/Ro ribonucleoprotein
MARLNIFKIPRATVMPVTHEGAPAVAVATELALRRSVLSCMLWENEFYESGVAITERIASLVPQVRAESVATLAVEARERMKLRHVPLLLVREMARHKTHRWLVELTLWRVIQRADELAEFVAIYWKDGKRPLSAQVKKGLAGAFTKFDEYQLAKYDPRGVVRLRDVLFLCHAKPRDAEQAAVWKRLIEGELATPDTWEVALSAKAGTEKRETWERLLVERKLGGLALLRNLRNIRNAAVDEKLVLAAIGEMNTSRVLPFRFISAAQYVPQWEPALERATLSTLAEHEKLGGRTVLLVDVSGSMTGRVSGRSKTNRADAAYGLAILLREICERVAVYTFSNELVCVPPRRGFALRDAMNASQNHGGTELGKALANLRETYDRIIVITDEQSHDRVPAPKGRGYVINVASNKNGVGYGNWLHIDGWSEAVVDYVRAMEAGAGS